MDFMLMFDRQYSSEGKVCLSSILEHGGGKVFVLCLDWQTEQLVSGIDGVVPIRRADLESRYPEIAITRKTRPWAPYTQSLKPFLPEYVFDVFGAKMLAYVDSDMLFWGDCAEVDAEMGDSSFMVTSREQEPPPPSGYFNGGFFACRDDENCREFLKWWQDKCVEWCLWTSGPDGRFGEEGYLNVFRTEPERFKGIRVSEHPGINLAPWNAYKHKVERTQETMLVDGRPLVCFHYQGFQKLTAEFRPTMKMGKLAELIYRPYHDLMPVRVVKGVGQTEGKK